MTYENFVSICNKLGDQSLPAGQRWKSIKSLKCDNINVLDFNALFNKGQAVFVEPSSGQTAATGFIIYDEGANDFGINDDPKITFIDIASVWSVTFLNVANKTSAPEVAQSAGYTMDTSIAFDKAAYTGTVGNEPYSEVKIKSVDPVSCIIGTYSTQADAESIITFAAMIADGELTTGKKLVTGPLTEGTYYIRGFAKPPYVGITGISTLTISSED